MELTVPKQMTDSLIIESNLTEAAVEWAAASTYVAGAVVKLAATHRKYIALKAVAANMKPSDNCTGLDPLWADNGVVNTWAAFDESINTKALGTNVDNTITLKLDSSRCSAVYVFGLENAKSVTVEVYDHIGAKVQEETISLELSRIDTWYDYFFTDFVYKKDFSSAIPVYGSSKVKIIITGITGIQPSVGAIVIGQGVRLGYTLYEGSDFGFVDYSTDDEDKWGRADLVQGPTAKRAEVQFRVHTKDFDRVIALIESVRGRLAVWDCNNTDRQAVPFERAIVLGRVRSFSPPVNGPVATVFSVEIRGVS